MFEELTQLLDELLIAVVLVSCPDIALRFFKLIETDDGFEGIGLTYPHLWGIDDTFSFQLEGAPVVDIGTDIFGVCQNLMDGTAAPFPVKVRKNAASIQQIRDFSLWGSCFGEESVDFSNDLGLEFSTRDEDDPIGLQALLFPARENLLWCTVLIHELSTQPESSLASLAKAQFDQTALSPAKTLTESSRLYSPAIARLSLRF